MSEPMTSGEIEDVLASIRRLVSQDLRPRPAEVPPAPAPESTKLILTPALRVVHPAAEVSEPAEAADWLSPEAAEGETAGLAETAEAAAPVADLPGVATEAGNAPGAAEPPAGAAEPLSSDPWAGDHDAADEAAAWPEPPAAVTDAAAADFAPPEPDRVSPPEAEAGELTDLDLFDAEALRDLVRDVLREELQGPLGERITRNIRKLVRAEIARALAAQDLD
jgi:hypothetical protein